MEKISNLMNIEFDNEPVYRDNDKYGDIYGDKYDKYGDKIMMI